MQTNLKTRLKEIRKVFAVTLFLNWSVALAKIIYGLITGLSSMTADGFHSLSDGASNIIGLIGITLASEPPDKNHPYGHKKYETFFSLGIAIFLIIICFNLFIFGIKKFHNLTEVIVNEKSFIIMIITIIINILVMIYEYKKGKEFKSDILITDSKHTSADILTSFSVIIALIAVKMGFPIADPIITILISCFIGFIAFRILKETSMILCDNVAVEDIKQIEGLVLSVKGVESCHRIRTRGRLDDIHVDLHVLVSPDMHIEDAHKICYIIEELIKEKITGVTDVVVHIEPM